MPRIKYPVLILNHKIEDLESWSAARRSIAARRQILFAEALALDAINYSHNELREGEGDTYAQSASFVQSIDSLENSMHHISLSLNTTDLLN